MGKKGWWRQLQSGDYPETQTNYGQDLEALHGFRGDRPIADQNKETKKLQKKCPQCSKLYWVDKNICNNCGYTNNRSPINEEEKKLLDKHIDFYKSLDSGNRVPETEEQKHFIEVCQGQKEPKTIHEKAYIKIKKAQTEKSDKTNLS